MSRWLLVALVVACDPPSPGTGGQATAAGETGGDAGGLSDGADDPAAPPPEPTYHGTVRATFAKHCETCHREGGIGPFVMSFDAAAWADGPPAWAPAAVAAIEAGTMPPWMPADDCLPIEGERGLSAAEIDAVQAWAAQDYPQGDPAAYVPPADLTSDLPPPDLVVAPAVPYVADRDRPDDYRCFVIDQDFAEDTWVSGFDVLPDQQAIVHHVILYTAPVDQLDRVGQLDDAEPGPGYTCYGSAKVDAGTLGGWAPGQLPERYPDGVARKIGKGSKLIMQVHYNTLNLPAGTEPPADATEVALWTLPSGEQPPLELVSAPVLNRRIVLPPGDPSVVQTQELTFDYLPIPVRVMGVFPHMHQLGTSITLERISDGEPECILRIPAWDFNWQQSYFWPKDDQPLVSAQDTFRLTCTYDNSAANQPVVNGVQQDPREVRWGDGTLDEMCLVYAHILVPAGFL